MSTQKKGGWGSVFSGAVANLESRLDNILAPETEIATRDAARNRVNDRLAERLAKATQLKPPSRTSTPINDAGSTRPSIDEKHSLDQSRPTTSNGTAQPTTGKDDEDETHILAQSAEDTPRATTLTEANPLQASRLPINPARLSVDSTRMSLDQSRGDVASARQSLDLASGAGHNVRDAVELQARIDQMESDYVQAEKQRQEEMHTYLERIDALQAKLTYLAKETVAAAKEANASSATSESDKQVAEKDERIALLMEEGEKLSKVEMRHLQTIKKLRAQIAADEKATAENKRKLERAERAELDYKSKLRKSEQAERHASEKVKSIATIEAQVEELRVDRENAAELVRDLTMQLVEAKEKSAKLEKELGAVHADQATIANLQNELEDAQIEKKLAEDRAAAEIRKTNEAAARQKERYVARDEELQLEIAALESRLEATRARAEEASANAGAIGIDGEGSIKLMRQMESLQQQYSVAKGNWETIETSLNARVAALEKERDEATRREGEVRKKARDAAAHSRSLEETAEGGAERIKELEREMQVKQDQISTLEASLENAETSQSDLKVEIDRQRKLFDAELTQRVEDEKQKWRREVGGFSPNPSRTESPTFSRKGSSIFDSSSGLQIRRAGARLTSQEMSGSSAHHDSSRIHSRRSSAVPMPGLARIPSLPNDVSPIPIRRESGPPSDSQSIPPTPSIEIDQHDYEDTVSSPHQTLGDFFSTSTAGPGIGGPSVQLVERMSALVRKLESEKASFKDELSRLGAQRDEARNQVVDLMREVDTKREKDSKVADLEKDLAELKNRYDASLEMLGEREEEVNELKMDVKELKTIYRELVETKVAGR
jgi:chromosome segregation ATPase